MIIPYYPFYSFPDSFFTQYMPVQNLGCIASKTKKFQWGWGGGGKVENMKVFTLQVHFRKWHARYVYESLEKI